MSAAVESHLAHWKQAARALKSEVQALSLAARDPRTPWVAKALIGLVLAYAFSPIDLIPDFVPVLGLLDDLLLVPASLALAIKLIPAEVMADSRAAARDQQADHPARYFVAFFIVLLWAILFWLVFTWLRGSFTQ